MYQVQEAKMIWQRLHVPNDPARTVCAAEFSRVTDRLTDRLTDLQTDTAIIGNNSLHLIHSMQPKTIRLAAQRCTGNVDK